MPTSDAAARAAYEAWHPRFTGDDDAGTPWYRLVRQHLDDARDLRNRRVLEVGCGRGGFSIWLSRTQPHPRVVAADLAANAVRMGRERSASDRAGALQWNVTDIQALPFPTGCFDTVVSCETIEHVGDPRRAVTELARVLRPGGRLFLTTPNYFGPMGLYRLYLRLRGRRYSEEGQPINHVTWLARTRYWIRRVGLRVVHSVGCGHYLPFPGAPPRRITVLDGVPGITPWLALHSLTVAEKPCVS